LIAREWSVRSLISTFLSTMGCTCVTVSNAQQLAGLQHESFDAVLIDIVDSMSAEQVIVSVRELYPSLSERILAFSSGDTDPEMVDVIERCGLFQIPRETLLPQIWARLQEFVAGSRISRLVPRSIEVAELIFDSFRMPLPTGMRCSHETGRHLAYRCKNTIVDLLITPDVECDRISLVGQVMGMGIRKAKKDRLVVLLMNGMKTVARTNTNQYGEFQLESEIVEGAGLQIWPLEGCWAAIPLGKMDWAKRPRD
jgi:CheY-like chemotaxis protein